MHLSLSPAGLLTHTTRAAPAGVRLFFGITPPRSAHTGSISWQKGSFVWTSRCFVFSVSRAGCTACTGAAGVCGKSAETAAAQDRLTGALIAFAGQLIAAGRGPAPEQARLLMQGLFTTITNVNFDPAAVDALTRRVHDASPGTGPDYDMQALWREPDADRRSLKCFVLFSLRGMAAYNYHARVLGRIDPELTGCCTALQAVGDPDAPARPPTPCGQLVQEKPATAAWSCWTRPTPARLAIRTGAGALTIEKAVYRDFRP